MIPKEDYLLIGQTLKTLVSQSALLYTLLNKIHWVRQADQLLQYRGYLLMYGLEWTERAFKRAIINTE